MTPGLSAFDVFKYLGSFALVIGLLLAVLISLKKLQASARFGRQSDTRLQVMESLSIGPRQKIALIRVGDREVLIGVTAQQITALGEMPAPEVAA